MESKLQDSIFREFVKLYEISIKVPDIHIDSGLFEVYKKKNGLPIGLGSREKHLSFIPDYKELDYFFQSTLNFWIIPIHDYQDNIFGFVFRAYDWENKLYRMVVNGENVPQVFWGFHNFDGFKKDNPIFLVEGLNENLFVSQVYPYTLSLLGSRLTVDGFEMLKNLSNMWILSLDNDESGLEAMEQIEERCVKEQVRTYRCLSDLKDWGDFFKYPVSAQESVKKSLKYDLALIIESDKKTFSGFVK